VVLFLNKKREEFFAQSTQRHREERLKKDAVLYKVIQ
jgi:hypothetical protein